MKDSDKIQTRKRDPSCLAVLGMSILALAVGLGIGLSAYTVVIKFARDNRGKPVQGEYDYSKATRDEFLRPFLTAFGLFLTLGLGAMFICNKRTAATETTKEEKSNKKQQ